MCCLGLLSMLMLEMGRDRLALESGTSSREALAVSLNMLGLGCVLAWESAIGGCGTVTVLLTGFGSGVSCEVHRGRPMS